MARKIGKLSPAEVRNKTKPGLYGDGGGLYLNVGPTGGKSWLFRFMLNGTAREMGLGPVHTIGLAEAANVPRRPASCASTGSTRLKPAGGESAQGC